MSQSLSKLYVHIIFHIKNSAVKIREDESQSLYTFIGKILKENDSIPIVINGVDDHLHILCVMSKNIALSKLIEELKRNSSRWIKGLDNYYQSFYWQGGYAGFSVSPALHDKTKFYIENQKEHHKKMTFKEEYLMFLKEYDIDYKDSYIWED
jgi:putative transposase